MAQFESMTVPPRLPLVVTQGNRNRTLTKDSKLVNCYMEIDEGQVWVFGRPGLTERFSGPAGLGQGTFNWRGDVYSILAGFLYRNGVNVGAVDSSNGVYRFSSILGAIPKMVFGNGAKTYAYTVAGGITADLNSIDPDFPATTVKGIVYLNGATYVMDPTGQIWGSAINSVSNPGDWSAVNFIAAQGEPDNGVFLAKQLVYVVAFGQWSTEFFFDAGNATGSPLGRVDGSKISFGCAHGDSVQQIDDRLFFVSATRSGAVQISMLDRLNHQVISDDYIDRLIQASNLSSIASFQLKIDGHNFYMVTFKDIDLTLVYDIETSEFHVWTDANGNYFPMVDYTFDGVQHIVQHESNGKLYYISTQFFNDVSMPIVKDIYTPIFDANTRRNKTLSQMDFIGDQEEGSILYVRFNDHDYKVDKWSNFRTVNLSRKRPFLDNCGTFRKRAYHFRHTANTQFRMQAVDVQYDLGVL